MIEIIKNTKINFIGARKVTYIISALLVLNGLWAVYKISAGKAKMGLDFTGGITVQVQFNKDVHVDSIRNILNAQKMPDAQIQQVGVPSDKVFLIRVGSQELSGENASGALTDVLKKETGDDKMTVLEQNEIGGIVSEQLKEKATLAVFWSLVAILLYIWIRFKFKFAVAATIATLHDVLAVLGMMVLLNKEIDLLTITALLTIAGYSLTDTVVVFDRIRENMKHILKKTYLELVNESINEVLSRTIITSLTVFAVAMSLFVFGGNVLHTFSLALCIGVIVGTYSSDLLASPIIVDWEEFEKKNRISKK
jgi:preprotein translocase subunit SecF